MTDRPPAADPGDSTGPPAEPLLSVSDLHVHFDTDEGTVRAVDGVSFTVDRGETVAIVGESGSGKTVTAEGITRLFKSPPARIPTGSVRFDGTELTDLPESALREIRGGRISHVFQNPQGALNPVYTVGWQLREAIRLHGENGREAADRKAIELLERVGLPEPAARLREYPHELSGGQTQRVLVAIALACDPDLLIADEPTTALDVTIQAQILALLTELQRDRELSMLFITHDLGVVAEVADRVVVMYAGKVMERGPVDRVLSDPAHPYTRALLRCLPGGPDIRGIPGDLPDPRSPPPGCRFEPRCPHAIDVCSTGEQPAFHDASAGGDAAHVVSCVHYDRSRSRGASSPSAVDGAETDPGAGAETGGDRR